MVSASQFRPNGPAALTSVRYARDLAEVQLRGALTGSNRTADEDVIARWHTEMAPFQFNRIARSTDPTRTRPQKMNRGASYPLGTAPHV